MNKIPVGQTISYGYSFGFGNFGGVLGIVWFPLLLMCVAAYFLYLPMLMATMSMIVGGHAPDPFAMQQLIMRSIGSVLLFDLIAVFLWSVIMTGITRLALGIDHPAPFYFSFGSQVWLTFASMILFGLTIIVFGFIVGIVLGIVDAMIFPSLGSAQSVLIFTAVQTLAVLVLFLFIALRLSYFVSPVVVSENKIGLLRSWTLTGGNFWRILGVVLAIALPPLIVFYIALVGVVMAMGLPAIQAGGQFPMGMLIALAVLYFLFSTLVMGMMNGAAAFAYRAVTGTPPAAPATM